MSPASTVVGECLALVAPAETAFRSRWRLSTLKRVNGDLHDMLAEQIDLYNTALVTGSDAEARTQAQAMVRGWRAACSALESPLLPDDAYLVGWDLNTGMRVVIADQKTAIGRVQSIKGERVMLVTPDEVARMMAAWSVIGEVKALFPDAEVLGVDA
jgi:hypothetical protein